EWQDRTHEFAAEREIQAVVDAARGGDLSRRIDPTGMHGFLRQFSDSVNELIQAVEQIFGETGSVLGALAQGDLTQRIEGDYAGRFLQLKSDINATVERLTDVLTQIKLASDWVKTGSSEISQGNTDLSQRTEEQGSSLEATAASMQSMTDAVRRNADSAAEANSLALASSAQAQRGGQVVNEAIAAMAEIDASSRKIGDIIGVIDEIAFQTNLLALNASVEAARAGEQGRGFAVVASEVRNLAGRSATAAREIKALIGDSGKKVNDGSRLVNQSGETLKQIVEGIQKVTQIVGDIASASQQQSSGIDKVNAEVSQMDKLTQQNAALVEQAAAASEAMGEQAESLDQLMAFFTVSGQRDLPVAQQSAKSEPATGDPLTTVPPLPPGGIERRAADRVWANSRVQKLANGVDDLGDGEQWSEF
ncbi:MAG: methyl-accepting chemotaxis protein, partial [Pseudomonadota bacterium]